MEIIVSDSGDMGHAKRAREVVAAEQGLRDISADEILHRMDNGQFLSFYDGESHSDAIAYSGLRHYAGSWYELGPMWVSPEERQKGVGTFVYKTAVERWGHLNLFGLSNNPTSKKLQEPLGFSVVSVTDISPLVTARAAYDLVRGGLPKWRNIVEGNGRTYMARHAN